MRTIRFALLLTAALTLVPLSTFAATPAKGNASHHIHATVGTVKSIDAKTLVLTRANKKKSELSFVLNGSTQRDGTIAAGTPVAVRYENEGKTHVATAVAVRPASVATHK